MQKILVVLVIILSFSGQVRAIDDACFECTYLSQAMRWIPKNCFEAKEALSGFDEQSSRLIGAKNNPLVSAWAIEFTEKNRGTELSYVKILCSENI
ncbi:hypothetical protein KC711_04620 [Candidatus Peregrinibacteria bacterium]|nr:hypothetical protein [Candidatus Peregrinibacteria bacterium]